MAENQLVEEWLRAARQTDHYALNNAALIAATIALAEGVKWIGESLAELVEMVRESEEANQLPCNEMGGGSAGLDTADDFAMHCSKPDKHDGPHSYEQEPVSDELTFLRSVEQNVQQIRGYVSCVSKEEAITMLTGLKVKLNARIVELLEEKDHANAEHRP